MNTKMVDLPWIDGTTRTVPEETVYVMRIGVVAFARDGGYSYRRAVGSPIRSHGDHSAAVCILTEAPEPPVKVDVPTGTAAIVSSAQHHSRPTFVRDRGGWRNLDNGRRYVEEAIANELRAGAVVLYGGVDEKPEPTTGKD